MIFGWDLGGAHIKLVVLDREGRLSRVLQVPCELWLGLDRLESALAQMLGEQVPDAVHAVTMTGELADVFADRAAGVDAITQTFVHMARAPDVMLFAGDGFVGAAQAVSRWADVASANWLATVQLTAQMIPQA